MTWGYVAALIIMTLGAPFASASGPNPACNLLLGAPVLAKDGLPAYPRQIDPQKTFDALVEWIHDEIIIKRKAPGLLVGISGTDSIVAFLAAYKAFEKAGRADRVAGIHYGPSETYLDELDNPTAAEALTWFQDSIIPWLRKQAPLAKIEIDTSFDFRRDGMRWGALVDWSVLKPQEKLTSTQQMRMPQDQYWLMGTRNKKEDLLFTYSNASTIASIQPLMHLWKSEILQISKFLGAPEKAIQKSCEADCVCGRDKLAAENIAELEALLMVRLGELSPEYTQSNIPAGLRKVLSGYIDSQIKGSKFKKEIPYTPVTPLVRPQQPTDPVQVSAARRAIQEGAVDSKPLTKLAPQIIAKGQAGIAADLVALSSQNRANWLPESLVLFNTPGLRRNQKEQMISALFSPKAIVGPGQVNELAELSGRIGYYGFTFPQWRFLTQRIGAEPSLAEQFKMKPLKRATDIRDASLPDPARDELGGGFAWQDGEWYIEYRRSYILVANSDTSLVIRNNSHFYGRDRLKNAVYFSLSPRSVEQLQAITAAELETSGHFQKWQDLLNAHPDMRLDEKLVRVSRLIEQLNRFNADFDQWIKKEGTSALLKLFESKANTPSGKPAIYLGVVDRGTPSWKPYISMPLTPDLLAHLKKPGSMEQLLSDRGKFVLMSGANGDFP